MRSPAPLQPKAFSVRSRGEGRRFPGAGYFSGLFLLAATLSAWGDPLQDAIESPFPIPNISAFNYTTSTPIPGSGWFPQSIFTLDGMDAAQSGPIPHNSDSRMWTTDPGTGPAVMTFWWKVSSEAVNDKLLFNAPFGQDFEISGEVDWHQKLVILPCFFTHDDSLRWRYLKDGSVAAGQDAGWVDRVDVSPLPNNGDLETALDYGEGKVFGIDWTNQADAGAINGSRAVNFPIGDNESAIMMVDFTAAAPVRVCFDWSVSSDLSDGLVFWVDNDWVATISGTVSESKCVELSAGRHCLAFGYVKDAAGSAGSDQGTVDNLNITQLIPRGELMNALDTATPMYGSPWVSVASPAHDGTDAACAMGVDVGESKSFFTTVTGPGTVSAWWKVSTDFSRGALFLAVDGVAGNRLISGETDWTPLSVPVGPGNHQLEFFYTRFAPGGSIGDNSAYVDQFSFTPSPAPQATDNSALKNALQSKIKKLKKKIRKASRNKARRLRKKLKKLQKMLRAL